MPTLLLAILSHTPLWVWGLLALLIHIGWKQTCTRDVSTARLVLLPLAIGLMSLWTADAAFAGAVGSAAVIGAWACGFALGLAANRWLDLPRRCHANPDGTFRVEGSLAPLALMLSVFLVRYANGVALAIHPAFKTDATYVILAAIVFAWPAGLLAARSRKVLGAPLPDGLAVA